MEQTGTIEDVVSRFRSEIVNLAEQDISLKSLQSLEFQIIEKGRVVRFIITPADNRLTVNYKDLSTEEEIGTFEILDGSNLDNICLLENGSRILLSAYLNRFFDANIDFDKNFLNQAKIEKSFKITEDGVQVIPIKAIRTLALLDLPSGKSVVEVSSGISIEHSQIEAEDITGHIHPKGIGGDGIGTIDEASEQDLVVILNRTSRFDKAASEVIYSSGSGKILIVSLKPNYKDLIEEIKEEIKRANGERRTLSELRAKYFSVTMI